MRMAKQKLDIQKVLKFKKSFWMKLSTLIKKWIFQDMIKGKVQAFTGFGGVYSEQYKKYKTNQMRRFTDGKRLGSPRKLKDGTTAVYKNNTLKGKSTNTSDTPNMMLTRELINGLAYLSSSAISMIMSYKEKDKMKIIGNRDRSITTLNQKNMERTKKAFINELDANVKKWARKTIVINVGAK